MNVQTEPPPSESSLARQRPRSTRVAVITVVTTAGALGVVLWLALTGGGTLPFSSTTTLPGLNIVYPTGTVDGSEPSGYAPPSANALANYKLSYVNDFTGASLPTGWDSYSGIPSGDPGGHFASSHVVVSGGLLRLNTSKDRAYKNKWVTGGACQCGLGRTYGAYFVRSRVTGAGPNEVELLWPLDNHWPPEIDFNETGPGAGSGSSTVHFGNGYAIDQRTVNIDMTRWHTWGLIWTRTSIIYTVDGREWGAVSVRSEIPDEAMTLDLEQLTKCQVGQECPTTPVSMLVDWVAEYTAK
jgi:hypothetical protein